jgi:hypothetical protein
MIRGYPALSAKDALKIGSLIEQHRLNSHQKSPAGFDDKVFLDRIKHKQPSVDFDQSALESLLLEFEANRLAIYEDKTRSLEYRKNETEEEFAKTAVLMTRNLPVQAIQDLDFWRYLAIFELRDYIFAIEGDFEPGRYGGHGVSAISRWPLIRGLVWGLHTVEEDDFSGISSARLAKEAAGFGTGVRDMYISQIIRRKYMKVEGSGRAYLDAVLAAPALFDQGNSSRPTQVLGASIGRVSENLYLPALNEQEMKSVFLELKKDISPQPQAVE